MPPQVTILQGHALDILKTLPDSSVQCCVTSPPYFNLRDYGTEDINWGDWVGSLGQEPTPDLYIGHLTTIFHEVYRVLRKDGTLWINIGDSFANDGKWGGKTGGKHAKDLHGDTDIGRRKHKTGLKPKNLIGIPWRLAFALQADGWYLRSDNMWEKPNAMPESILDRPTRSHEYMFQLSKSEHYYFDMEAVKQWAVADHSSGNNFKRAARLSYQEADGEPRGNEQVWEPTPTRHLRSVWCIPTRPFRGSHFATMPPDLARIPILAGSSPRACEHCGAPWKRIVERRRMKDTSVGKQAMRGMSHIQEGRNPANRDGREWLKIVASNTAGWKPTCKCPSNTGAARCFILDPFGGSGTTSDVARKAGRDAIIIELNPDYIDLINQRHANLLLWDDPAV